MTDHKKEDKTEKHKREFLSAFELAGGNISVTCKKVGISRETYYRWRREDKDFDTRCEDVKESLIDLAETMLMKNIKSGKTAEIIFFLKTKGKDRGYIETHEVIDPRERQPDLSKCSNEELRAILNGEDNDEEGSDT